ncbi:uncharacterized protein ISCGN_030070 [Ixodes scapularis]
MESLCLDVRLPGPLRALAVPDKAFCRLEEAEGNSCSNHLFRVKKPRTSSRGLDGNPAGLSSDSAFHRNQWDMLRKCLQGTCVALSRQQGPCSISRPVQSHLAMEPPPTRKQRPGPQGGPCRPVFGQRPSPQPAGYATSRDLCSPEVAPPHSLQQAAGAMQQLQTAAETFHGRASNSGEAAAGTSRGTLQACLRTAPFTTTSGICYEAAAGPREPCRPVLGHALYSNQRVVLPGSRGHAAAPNWCGNIPRQSLEQRGSSSRDLGNPAGLSWDNALYGNQRDVLRSSSRDLGNPAGLSWDDALYGNQRDVLRKCLQGTCVAPRQHHRTLYSRQQGPCSISRPVRSHLATWLYMSPPVSTALRVLSHSTATALRFLVENHGWSKDFLTTAWFFEQWHETHVTSMVIA